MDTQHAAIQLEDAYPLSPLQQGMLFNTLLEPGSGVDIEQLVCELHETLDVAAFRHAWQAVVARHPVLRTNLRWENLDEPRQEVHRQVELPWEERDWRDIAAAERDRRIAEFLAADRNRSFDLARAPLFRLTLLRFSESEFHLILTFHHTILEGRSYFLILREAFAFYEAFRDGREINPPAPRPYRDYIAWLQRQDFSKDETFWRETLKGFAAPTPLVIDHAPDVRRDHNAGHGTSEVLLSAESTSALRVLARENQITLNTIVQGAWAILLSRYSGETDIVFGVIRANRRSTVQGAEQMVGLFLNTLPLRIHVDPAAALLPWLHEVRRQWMAMREHEHAPLAQVQSLSEVPRGSQLFTSTLMFENYDLDTELRKQGGAWSARRFRLVLQTNYLLDLAACDGTELRLRLDFDRSRIDAAAVPRMLGHLQTLLESIAVEPQRKIGQLPILTSAERHQLLAEWNRTSAQYSHGSCLHELFEVRAEKTPDAVAVSFEDRNLTYRELNRRSNQLAHRLRSLGVGPDVLVGICAERSLEMVVGLLGILKAGGAYVPIDPSYPAARIEAMLRDINASVVIAQQNVIHTLPALKQSNVVSLDALASEATAEDVSNPVSNVTSENLAYVLYTSGSTGRPKGAMIPHRAIANHLQWMQATFPMDERDCVLQMTEFSFDVSVWEIFAPLSAGARLVIARPGGNRDPAYLTGKIMRRGVTVLQLVPSLLRVLLATREFKQCLSLRHVFCGGEVMTAEIPRDFYATLDASLHNMYGPTETAIDALYYSVPRDHQGPSVPIGRPIANTRAYVLDTQLQPVPVGISGELYLGGIQVGRGYFKQPELTAERFIQDVFSSEPGARLYKTGDTVRFLPDGNLQFLGRADHQVKIRGIRIELGEIEAALKQHPGVRECAAVMQDDAIGEKRLVAYVVPADPVMTTGKFLDLLKEKLPVHMIPSAILVLPALPVGTSGKLDRGALPRVSETYGSDHEPYIAPRTQTETILAENWRKLLKLKQIGVRDNFFDLGGHSLLIVSLINEINSTLDVDISVPDFFNHPTVERLARVIDELQIQRKPRSGVVSLQHGRTEPPLYFIYAGPDQIRVAQSMGEGRSVFGIDIKWPLAWRRALTGNRRSAIPTLEQLAAPYAAALSAHAGTTPCIVAGHSFAGLIAFEVARQLRKQGGNVEMVVLFDTWARYPTPYRIAWHNLRDSWKRASTLRPAISAALTSSWLIIRRFLGQQKIRIWALFDRRAPDSGSLTTLLDEEDIPLPGELLQRLYIRIEDSYRPCVLDTRGVLFVADSTDEKKAVRTLDGSLGWKNLFAKGLKVVPISGSHLSIMREHSAALARELNNVLNEKWPGVQDNNRGGTGESQPVSRAEI